MPIGRDVASWARASAAVPASVPAKPFPVRLGPPFNQNGRSEDFLRVLLIDIGTQHQTDIRSFPKVADPGAHRPGKFARLEPVIGEINPSRLFANRLFVTRDIFRRDIMLGWIVFIGANAVPIKAVIKFSAWRRSDTCSLRVQSHRATH